MGTYDFIDHAGQRLGAIMQKPPQDTNVFAPSWTSTLTFMG